MLNTSKAIAAVTLLALTSACAGRDARPVLVSQPQDNNSSCLQVQSELASNQSSMHQLDQEKTGKIVQNVSMGVLGLLIWPLWFAMDFKGAAETDQRALEQRNAYLTSAAAAKCAPVPSPTVPASAVAAK